MRCDVTACDEAAIGPRPPANPSAMFDAVCLLLVHAVA